MNDYADIYGLNVIHFTRGATDPLQGFRSHGVRVVMLADGVGADETYVSCLHIEPGGWITDPPAGRDSVVLIVHGDALLIEEEPGSRHHHMTAGVGVVLNADVPFRIESEAGALLIVVEAERLQATESGISTANRIWGQTWPGEDLDKPKPRTIISLCRKVYYRWRWRKMFRVARIARLDQSGWKSARVEPGAIRRIWNGWVGNIRG